MLSFKSYIIEATREETIQKLKDHLADGKTAHITFQKADGTETTRHATLNPEHINQGGGDGRKTDKPKAASTTSMPFYSIDDNGWRAFSHERFIGWRPHLGAVTFKPKD